MKYFIIGFLSWAWFRFLDVTLIDNNLTWIITDYTPWTRMGIVMCSVALIAFTVEKILEILAKR